MECVPHKLDTCLLLSHTEKLENSKQDNQRCIALESNAETLQYAESMHGCLVHRLA